MFVFYLNIRLSGRISGDLPDIRSTPDILPDIRYPATKVSGPTLVLTLLLRIYTSLIKLIFVGSPVTNTHYIASPHGEIYGLDHTRERFEPEMVAKLR